MADDSKHTDENDDAASGSKEKSSKWSTGAKVGAAVGSAAIAAALIYAGRHKMRKLDEFKSDKPKPGTRYENEPDDDGDGA